MQNTWIDWPICGPIYSLKKDIKFQFDLLKYISYIWVNLKLQFVKHAVCMSIAFGPSYIIYALCKYVIRIIGLYLKNEKYEIHN
jgi:hypothetical protein